ncbi:MAG: cytochrome c biogenesis protein ResB [Halopseudomonas sp.]
MWNLLISLRAPRWTVLFFLLTALSSYGVSTFQWPASYILPLPLMLLVVNLSAAIITLPRFRKDLPLLIFHLALVLMIVLLAIARLTYFTGTTAINTGDAFDGHLLSEERGPLHGQGVQALRFFNQGFYEEPSPYGEHFTYTRNRVRWQDQHGQHHSGIIGDDTPLLLGFYRIYTTSRRGFSPLFRWTHPGGQAELGSVQLSVVIDDESPPTNNWTLPNGAEAWAMLAANKETGSPFVLPPNTQKGLNLNAQTLTHQLILRVDQQRYSLKPGQTISLENGTLTYLQLDTWMGYQIIYDPTQPWLLATIAVGVLSLLWFYYRQLSGSHWDSDR